MHAYAGTSYEHTSGGIAVDGSGNVYVTGSAVAGMTTTANAYRTTYRGTSGNTEAFMAEFNPFLSGSASLLYSSYLGGVGEDTGMGLALDPSGNAYITGVTFSSNFPVTTGAFQTRLDGESDSFTSDVSRGGRGAGHRPGQGRPRCRAEPPALNGGQPHRTRPANHVRQVQTPAAR
jgi:hypothetical protein